MLLRLAVLFFLIALVSFFLGSKLDWVIAGQVGYFTTMISALLFFAEFGMRVGRLLSGKDE